MNRPILDGGGNFTQFLQERILDSGAELDVAMECSTWTQVIDAMSGCGLGGFLPKDLAKQFPVGFKRVALPGLTDYADDYVIAWAQSEVEKRPEIAGLVKSLGVNR